MRFQFAFISAHGAGASGRGAAVSSGRLVRGLAVALLVLLLGLATFSRAQAQGLIRDTEIETLISEYSQPILQAAGLSAQNIKIHLIGARSFNAFVIDGRNMFIHVGAIMHAKTPNELIGVIAHEAGHIAGGHLSRLRAFMAKAQNTALMLQILGIAAMAAGAISGAGAEVGQAGQAVMLGGQSAVLRSVLAYRRIEEFSADQAAVRFLNRTQQSGRGMLTTFEFFAEQARGAAALVDPYLQTHPMPTDRIAQLRGLVRESPYFERRDSEDWQRRHDMIRAKLEGFMNQRNPQAVFNMFPASDNSMPARYARAIARNFSAGIDAALPDINALIAAEPDNPYFHELKGQFLLESGRVREAIPSLRKAVELAPEAGIIRIMFAQALLATNERDHLLEAQQNLRRALVTEEYSPSGYRQLAIAYGRLGRIPDAELASAQAYFYEGNLKLAKEQAERAKAGFPPHSASWVKADDIVRYEPPSE